MANFELDLTEEQKESVRQVITRVPRNEDETKRIFFELEDVLGFSDVRLFISYPDATAFFQGKKINIEFEYLSSHFRQHGHDEKECDLIICWEDDINSVKIPVLELATLVEDWIEERKKAMSDYFIYREYNIIPSRFSDENKSTYQKDILLHSLTDKYYFDWYDCLAYRLGVTKEHLKKYYPAPKNPECIGGELECEKRAIKSKYLGIKSNSEKLVAVVLCKECKNKSDCSLGMDQELGYFFFLNQNPDSSREMRIIRLPIKSEEVLSDVKKYHTISGKDFIAKGDNLDSIVVPHVVRDKWGDISSPL